MMIQSHQIKTIIFVLASGIPILCQGQSDKNNYRSHKIKADSIVTLFVGRHIFEKYITLDSSKSKFCSTGKDQIRKTKFNKNLTFKPDLLVFNYIFNLPTHPRESFRIIFSLDTTGRFIFNDETYGLIDALDFSESEIVSKKEALRICKDEAYKMKRFSITLEWNDNTLRSEKFDQTKELRDIALGRIVWRVKGKEKFRGTIYNGVYEVDVLTGRVGKLFAIPWD